jgi:hypothetical protein
MSNPIFETSTQSGVYTLTPSPRTYVVRRENGELVGLLEERIGKSWTVPMAGNTTYETSEDAIEALLKHNRENGIGR